MNYFDFQVTSNTSLKRKTTVDEGMCKERNVLQSYVENFLLK